jgi:hypothetical protein
MGFKFVPARAAYIAATMASRLRVRIVEDIEPKTTG